MPEQIQLPAADRGAGKVAPIRFPKTRANHDAEQWRQQVESRDALIRSAAHDAYYRGERDGYTQGWHFGMICGVCLGSVAVAVLWLSWAPLQRVLAAWGLA